MCMVERKRKEKESIKISMSGDLLPERKTVVS